MNIFYQKHIKAAVLLLLTLTAHPMDNDEKKISGFWNFISENCANLNEKPAWKEALVFTGVLAASTAAGISIATLLENRRHSQQAFEYDTVNGPARTFQLVGGDMYNATSDLHGFNNLNKTERLTRAIRQLNLDDHNTLSNILSTLGDNVRQAIIDSFDGPNRHLRTRYRTHNPYEWHFVTEVPFEIYHQEHINRGNNHSDGEHHTLTLLFDNHPLFAVQNREVLKERLLNFINKACKGPASEDVALGFLRLAAKIGFDRWSELQLSRRFKTFFAQALIEINTTNAAYLSRLALDAASTTRPESFCIQRIIFRLRELGVNLTSIRQPEDAQEYPGENLFQILIQRAAYHGHGVMAHVCDLTALSEEEFLQEKLRFQHSAKFKNLLHAYYLGDKPNFLNQRTQELYAGYYDMIARLTPYLQAANLQNIYLKGFPQIYSSLINFNLNIDNRGALLGIVRQAFAHGDTNAYFMINSFLSPTNYLEENNNRQLIGRPLNTHYKPISLLECFAPESYVDTTTLFHHFIVNYNCTSRSNLFLQCPEDHLSKALQTLTYETFVKLCKEFETNELRDRFEAWFIRNKYFLRLYFHSHEDDKYIAELIRIGQYLTMPSLYTRLINAARANNWFDNDREPQLPTCSSSNQTYGITPQGN